MSDVTTLGAMSTMCAEPHQDDEPGSESYEHHQHYHVADCQHQHYHGGYDEANQHHHHHHHHHLHSHQQQSNQDEPQAHHDLHHHHYQSLHQSSSAALQHTSSIASSSNSSLGGEVTCCDQSRYFTTCRCSNRLLTTIVITILPIAITLTLISVFMMQKTNLHQYAIYFFVTFCILFVFPFALFFFTVVLNKIYKFYKREIRSTPSTSSRLHHQMLGASCDFEAAAAVAAAAAAAAHTTNGSNGYETQSTNAVLMVHGVQDQFQRQLRGFASNGRHHQQPQLQQHSDHYQAPNAAHLSMATAAADGQTNANLVCYDSAVRAYPNHHHPQSYYYQTEDGTIVALSPNNNATQHEDSPPPYEMALLCPSLAITNAHNNHQQLQQQQQQHQHYPMVMSGNYAVVDGKQVILPQGNNKSAMVSIDSKEKSKLHQATPERTPPPPLVSQCSNQQSDDSDEDYNEKITKQDLKQQSTPTNLLLSNTEKTKDDDNKSKNVKDDDEDDDNNK